MVRTYIDLVEWIRQNAKTTSYEGTPEQAALWCCAYLEAETWCEMGPWDIAHVMIKGMTPYNSADVGNYLDNLYADVSEYDAWEDLERNLQGHFNV
jgi:hypothetical protein